MIVTEDLTETRRAFVAPAIATLREDWEMYEELADAARGCGDLEWERLYRERVQSLRDSATRLLKLAG